jgi:DNA-binding transcriptional ArsR family regulator
MADADDADVVEAVFAALAHAQRRQILLVLHFRGGRMTAGEIAERFSCTWPTTTRHLKLLIEAGLVRVEKEGRERWYTLAAEQVTGVTGKWLSWFKAKDSATGKRDRR